MRRAIVVSVAVASVGAGLLGLAEATQTRPDRVRPGTATELVLGVRGKRVDASVAASSLVAACRPTAGRSTLSEPAAAGGGRFLVVARPALGHHASRRLLGCLADATIDRVSAHVVARRDRVDESAGDEAPTSAQRIR
jgi:hypothetical protein